MGSSWSTGCACDPQLAATVAPMRLADNLATGDVERREQRSRAEARVVVGAPLEDTGGQRQDGLRAVERLNPATLVHSQHHGLDRGIEIEAHDVSHLSVTFTASASASTPRRILSHASSR